MWLRSGVKNCYKCIRLSLKPSLSRKSQTEEIIEGSRITRDVILGLEVLMCHWDRLMVSENNVTSFLK